MLRFASLAVIGLFLWTRLPAVSLAPDRLIAICNIQGEWFSSRRQGDTLKVRGVVTADLDITAHAGFYLQQDGCDGKQTTSNGIFVLLTRRVETVSGGDLVTVTGVVQEFYGRTQILAAPEAVTLVSHANLLPMTVELMPPFAAAEARSYFEALEGMRVSLSAGRVAGPTAADERTWVVRSDLGLERVFFDDPAGVSERICIDQDGLYALSPAATVGDQVAAVVGVLDFHLGEYCVLLTEAAQVEIGSRPSDPPPAILPGLSVATFNLAGLFDRQDDPLVDDSVLTQQEYLLRLYKRARAIRRALGEPAILAVQEAENRAVLESLIADPDILRSDYQVLHVDGPDKRGIDLAILYRADRVWPYEYHVYQGCTALVDGLGPDGNDDPLNPSNIVSCDLTGDGIPDGNRLFARPPLAARFGHISGTGQVWVIANHWKSKVEDTDEIAYTLPRRLEQARFVAGLATNLHAAYPAVGIAIVGDFNDVITSQPLQELLRLGFVSLSQDIPGSLRYTYIHDGVSQQIDHILWLPGLAISPQTVVVEHINADFPVVYEQDIMTYRRSSDHDPLLAFFGVASSWLYLPMVVR